MLHVNVIGGNNGNRTHSATATRRQQQRLPVEPRERCRFRLVPGTCCRERYRQTRKWPSHG